MGACMNLYIKMCGFKCQFGVIMYKIRKIEKKHFQNTMLHDRVTSNINIKQLCACSFDVHTTQFSYVHGCQLIYRDNHGTCFSITILE